MPLRVSLALLLALLLPPPTTTPTPAYVPQWIDGYASAYAPGVMEGVVRLRFDEDWWPVTPPIDWYTVHGYIAAMDCARVGEVTTLQVAGRDYRVFIADCAGDDGPPDRFERMNVVVELGWEMWDELTQAHGRPLSVRLGD